MKRIQLEDQSKSVVEIDEATMVLIREGLDAIDRGEVMTFEGPKPRSTESMSNG